MTTINPELQQQIAIWRQKCADNTITQEEMRAAVIHLRAGRVAAAAASTASRVKRAVAEVPKADDLLAELMK
jgi:hypothetical protein